MKYILGKTLAALWVALPLVVNASSSASSSQGPQENTYKCPEIIDGSKTYQLLLSLVQSPTRRIGQEVMVNDEKMRIMHELAIDSRTLVPPFIIPKVLKGDKLYSIRRRYFVCVYFLLPNRRAPLYLLPQHLFHAYDNREALSTERQGRLQGERAE